MRINTSILFCFAAILAFSHCEKQDPTVNQPVTGVNEQARISVYVYYNPTPQFPDMDQPLADVTVELYETQEDQNSHQNAIRTATTNAAGNAFLGSHEPDVYYVSATRGSWTDRIVNAVSGTESFVDLRID